MIATQNENELVDQYLEETGQTFQELMSGASQVGFDYVTSVLVPKALKEKKIIVWKSKELALGTGEYILQNPV